MRFRRCRVRHNDTPLDEVRLTRRENHMFDTSRGSRKSRQTLRVRWFNARRAGQTLTEKTSAPIPAFSRRPRGGDIAHTGFGESGDFGPPVGPDREYPVGFSAECQLWGTNSLVCKGCLAH